MNTIAEATRTQSNAGSPPQPGGKPASERLAEQAKKVSQEVQEMGTVVKETAQEKLEQWRDTAEDLQEQGKEKVYQAERTIEQYIREQPMKSVLIAAVVGLVFGRVFMRH